MIELIPAYPESVEELDQLINESKWHPAWCNKHLELTEKKNNIRLRLAQKIWKKLIPLIDFEQNEEDDDLEPVGNEEEIQKSPLCQNSIQIALILIGVPYDCDKPPSKAGQKNFADAICIEVRAKNENIEVNYQARLLYLQIIRYGLKNNLWALCEPSYPIRRKRPGPRVKISDRHLIDISIKTRTKLIEHLQNKTDWFLKNTYVCCLFSAIFWGGLIDKHALDTFFKSMQNPLFASKTNSWIDLPIYENSPEKSRIRRFIFDKVSESIWLTMPIVQPTKNTASELIENALTELHDGLEITINQFLKAVTCEFSTQLPEIIIYYATGQMLNHPILADRWQSIEGIKQITPIKEEDKSLQTTIAPNTEENDANNEPLIQLIEVPGLPVLRKAMREKSTKAMRQHLNSKSKIYVTGLPIIIWLARWISSKKLTSKISTRRWMFGLIGARLASICDDQDIAALDDEELERIYALILEDGNSPSHRSGMRYALKSFHKFVFKKSGSSILQEIESLQVSARIITHDEYHLVLEQLKRTSPTHNNPEWLEICQIVFILFFRLGLRRRELMFLPLHDIHGDHFIEILIRPYHDRELKTANALRKLQVNGFLSESELDKLKDWIRKRRESEIKTPTSFQLFALGKSDKQHVSIDGVIDHIVEVVRKITGDQNFHLHHLRHSFATWSAMGLIGEAAGTSFSFLDQLPLTQQWVTNFHKVIDQNFIGEPSHRGRVFQLSVLMGHSSPAITMEHYVHCMDVLLKNTISTIYPIDSNLVAHAALDLAPRTRQRWLSLGESEFRNKLLSSNPNRVIAGKENVGVAIEEPLYDVLYKAWEVLKTISNEGKIDWKNPTIAPFNKVTVNNWLSNLTELQQKNAIKQDYPNLGGGKPAVECIKSFLLRASKTIGVIETTKQLKIISNIWIKNKVNGRPAARFKTSQEAKDYLALLINLGLTWKELKLSWVGSRFNKKQEKAAKTHWRKKLGLSNKIKIHTVKLGNDRPLSANKGYFDMVITNPGKDRASFELQWVFLMTLIVFS